MRLLILFLFSTSIGFCQDYTSFVNPLIGTGGHGHTYPGAAAPFGFMQLSPDSRKEGWDGCGGYHDSDSTLYGFSHTHLSGTGVSDLADLLILPYSITYKEQVSFDKEKSIAKPGYYETYLPEDKIKARLTVTAHSGMHEYNFSDKKNKSILIDLGYRDLLLDATFKQINDTVIQGSRISSAWATNQHFYFYLVSDTPISNLESFENKFFLTFSSENKVVKLKVGISVVDIEGAQRNLKKEITDWDFEKVKSETKEKWNQELSKIEIATNNLDEKIVFYSALYHSFLNPNIFSDVDGRYRGTDGEIHSSKDHNQYTIFSLWDTFRATHPLFTLTQREKTRDFIHTFLQMYEQGGELPMWELHGNYTGCMIGYHSVPVIVDAWMKGIRDFDEYMMLEAMISTSIKDELGKPIYADKGFLSTGDEPESVSKTLEYAYNDWCIAIFADSLGSEEIAQEYYERALSYRNLYNPDSKFMQPKKDGIWASGFKPEEVNFNFTEANSYQYSLFAPQDVAGLIDLLGGKDELEAWLDRLFTTELELSGRHQVDITGLIGQYAHGNEPSHHMAYLYNFTNAPEKTQFYIQKILKEQYWNAPDGLSGNEDCGQMSSWYVLSSLGFYSLTPGLDEYQIGFPLFDSAAIKLENEKQFSIETIKTGNSNNYIKSISLNGNEINHLTLKHKEILSGGKLVFTLGDQPNSQLKSIANSVEESAFISVPYFLNESISFIDSTTITVGHHDKDVEFVYTNSEPDNYGRLINWYEFPKEGMRITSTTSFYIVAKKNGVSSKPVHTTFYARTKDKKITLNTQYSNQYNGGGQDALIDQQIGNANYRSGLWQGFQKEDVEFEIDLLTKKKVNTIQVRTLADIRSWIFHSPEVKIWYSKNGKKWKEYGVETFSLINRNEDSNIHKYNFSKSAKARYIKVEVQNFGPCPEWHLGAGGDTWLFLDEIIID